jgi:hypothetical protein
VIVKIELAQPLAYSIVEMVNGASVEGWREKYKNDYPLSLTVEVKGAAASFTFADSTNNSYVQLFRFMLDLKGCCVMRKVLELITQAVKPAPFHEGDLAERYGDEFEEMLYAGDLVPKEPDEGGE